MKKKISFKNASCLCGGIKIKIYGKLRYVNNCHCNQCMKTHGNFAAYTACLEDDFKFINNKTLKWFKSSNIAKRGFCSTCGASVFYKRNNSDMISIAAGIIENPTMLKSRNNIFTKGKMDYYKLDPKLSKFSKGIVKR